VCGLGVTRLGPEQLWALIMWWASKASLGIGESGCEVMADLWLQIISHSRNGDREEWSGMGVVENVAMASNMEV
jgi:hypothetical protein